MLGQSHKKSFLWTLPTASPLAGAVRYRVFVRSGTILSGAMRAFLGEINYDPGVRDMLVLHPIPRRPDSDKNADRP